MTIRIARKTLFLAAALLAATAAQAQQQRPDFSKVEIKTTKLADNFYTLEGQGGTISVLTGPDGVLLVDSQFAPLTEKLVAAIRQVSDKPIRFLVNTHVHGDHVGGNENFAKLGAVIFARQQLRERLEHPAPAADGAPGKPAAPDALPVVTYDDPVTIHLDGENVRLLPIRNAHTDGDTLVSFPQHDILAVGDYFRSVGYPIVDLNNGGSLNGLLEALRVTIERAGPDTKIILGHGPIVGRDAVIAQRDLLIAYRDKVAVLVGQNKTLEEVIAAKITAPTDAQIPLSEQSAERFVKWLYAEVKAAKLKS
ncbi:MBL fold metallo-hydrolase [uncultured Rhodoblastus sp.]|uniref:MBL fold metallo-hydrolase n=1 Tax=uncultured Rhodoblastus sp. TaxID=543037 RepID=UPI0025FE7668|nr:MBL fold metallo-hydrolase [uncultured Rhodoblastus sp.]